MAGSTVPDIPKIARNPVVERLAAIGFFAYGAVYTVLGALAAKVALGTGGRITDSKGAILEVARQPFGSVLLLVVMFGLFAYSFWRLLEAFGDPEGNGRGWYGVAVRGGQLFSAFAYGALAIFTLQTVIGARSEGGSGNWALRMITEPLGAVVGALVGLIIVGAAIEQFRKAITGDFGEHVSHAQMTRPERTWGRYAAHIGFTARGTVFALSGVYLLYAVFDANPGQAKKSVEELLLALLRFPYGKWILGFVGFGLAAYGMFMVLVAMHHRRSH
jgi:hypothetical protein